MKHFNWFYCFAITGFLFYIVLLVFRESFFTSNEVGFIKYIGLIPLVLVLPGLITRRAYAFKLGAFLSLFYFCGSVVRVAGYWPMKSLIFWVSCLETFSLVLFFIAVLFLLKAGSTWQINPSYTQTQ